MRIGKLRSLGSCLLPVLYFVKLLESDHSSCGFIPQFITRQSETLPDTNFTGILVDPKNCIHALLQVVIRYCRIQVVNVMNRDIAGKPVE